MNPCDGVRQVLAAACVTTMAMMAADVAAQTSVQPVTLNSGAAALTPQNTLIQFTGTHVGDDPNPRVGVFQKFAGSAKVEAGQLRMVSVDIQTSSLETPIGNLTNHLKSPDFFDAREYPSAKFVSTSVVPAESGDYTITGELTIMATTKEISFPARINADQTGLTLIAALELDRTQFGMDKMTDRVNKKVVLDVTIGKASQLPKATDNPEGRSR